MIVIMSGSFVQRGAPAIADKYSRAKSALLCGADLVLELPALYAASSAELFAAGAVRTLEQLGITYLSFGCETDDLQTIEQTAQILAQEPEEYKEYLRQQLAKGLPFPKAREYALKFLYPNSAASLNFHQPNTILALEYCKALYQCQSRMIPVPVKRLGGAYHQLEQDITFSSASSIRRQLADHGSLEIIKDQLPKPSWLALKKAIQMDFPIFDEDSSAFIRFALLQVPGQDYTPYLDISQELSNRIAKHLFDYQSFHSFVSLLKTKERTYTQICRALIHILLGMMDADLEAAKAINYVPYFHVLGVKSESTGLLGHICRNSKIPLITNPVNAFQQLSAPAKRLLELDCYSTHIWNSIAGEKFAHATECEYTRKFLKV